MNNYNIDINSSVLSETISKLKNDNQKVTDTINLIYDNINQLTDDEIWKSPEKQTVMDELMPYLDETKENINLNLDSCLNVLNTALNKYIEDNRILKEHADVITEIKEV